MTFTGAIKSKMIRIYHVLFLHYDSFLNYHNHVYYWLSFRRLWWGVIFWWTDV